MDDGVGYCYIHIAFFDGDEEHFVAADGTFFYNAFIRIEFRIGSQK